MRYIFWGSPEFAAVSLKALLASGYPPMAVVTATDKASGRGQKLTESPVKKLALENNLPVWQPVSLKDPDFVHQVRELQPQFMVVVAFRMLPQEIIEIPQGGTWNLHASLLPDLRGAAPIHWALRLGYVSTGLTVFKIQYQIDTGDLLESVSLEIPQDWNAGVLHDVMAMEGARLLVKVLPQIAKGEFHLIPQDRSTNLSNSQLHHAPKIQRSDAAIDWNHDTNMLVNFVRAFAPSPGAFTYIQGIRMVILEAISDEPNVDPLYSFSPGYCLVQGNCWWIRTQDGWLKILQIKPQNSKAMNSDAYLRGHGVVNGQICSKDF
jgi:methionyl-tRNA formyltransferase